MIVDCAVYEEGERRNGDLPLGRASEAARGDGAFVWIGLHEPGTGELDAVAREFGLHELAVEDAVKAHQRPKLETYGDTLFVVLKSARYDDEQEAVEIGEILLFVHQGFIVSVRHGEASALTDVRAQVEERADLLRCGPGAILHAIVDRVVDDYEAVAQGVEIDVQEVEAQVFSPGRDNPAERIFRLERQVLDFQRAVVPLAPAVERLARGDFAIVTPELREYFRDVDDHLRRVSGRVQGFRDLLFTALQANLTQVSVRQNEDMRKISAWVAIIAVPTAIAGIYGMNFEFMPELKWRLGYPAVLVLILVICSLLYRRFRRVGWL
ncbi:MAG TPA: magnesium/cobalt transporter CorA [Solirubrobacteraceae bacterium]|nr:magnesium/cobalt transporter CorA [Solirubrobacteraceae bacterium]